MWAHLEPYLANVNLEVLKEPDPRDPRAPRLRERSPPGRVTPTHFPCALFTVSFKRRAQDPEEQLSLEVPAPHPLQCRSSLLSRSPCLRLFLMHPEMLVRVSVCRG